MATEEKFKSMYNEDTLILDVIEDYRNQQKQLADANEPEEKIIALDTDITYLIRQYNNGKRTIGEMQDIIMDKGEE